MRLFLSLTCLLLGISICTCTLLGTPKEDDPELAGNYEENINQEEADESEDDGDGYNDDDAKKEEEDATRINLDLVSSNLATGLTFRPPVKLHSGDTVTIQVVHSMRLHIGCRHTKRCGAQFCAGMYYEPEEYVKCRGEVFQIYRAAGPGEVKVGDNVGFYYPMNRKWLGGSSPAQVTAGCPGVPRNSHHRLNIRCHGEVFQLYARGKRRGQPIDQLDHVMIYFLQSKAFYAYHPNTARDGAFVRSSCPGKCLPPYPDVYERCYTSVFAIRKKLY